MNSRTTCILLCLCMCYVTSVTSYKYLTILHTAARSHHIVGSALVKGLAAKGHEVTLISPYPSKSPIKNVRDIALPSMMKVMEKDINGLLDTLNKSIVENIVHFHDMGIQITEAVLTEPEVQLLMKSNTKFDAVICEVFLSEALFGLAEHFKAPLIGLGTFGAITWNTDMTGSPSPPSYVPHAMLRFSDRMSLTERVGNLAFLTFERIFLNYFYLPRQEELYKKYFPNNRLTFEETRRSASIVMLNQHVSISYPRPYVPNQIEVAGMHINSQRKPLPTDIAKFINESTHGVIYFSMGSNLKSKSLPIDRREAILNTFRGLKQRVLWKFEDPELPGKPDNVFISDWFPQDDILAHENVKAFITHGGLLSTTESIYHGKPFIGIPIFGDQFLNMARAVQNGYGIQLDYNKLDPVSFKAAIVEITSNPKYTQQVSAMSARYRDQPEEPMTRAIYWVEHIAKHKGATYMHCAGLDLNFIQYHNIDVILIFDAIILALIGLEIYIIVALARCFKGLIFEKQPKIKAN